MVVLTLSLGVSQPGCLCQRHPALAVNVATRSLTAMGRVLVGWASRAGAASDVAAMLADELRIAGHDVDVADLKASPSVAERDLVVLGSGIQAGQWYPEALTWVAANSAQLEECCVALFNVCLNAAEPAKREDSLGYNKVLAGKVLPVAEESFAGRYVPEKVSWVKRLLLRSMKKERQDHVDEAKVRAWGRTLVGVLDA